MAGAPGSRDVDQVAIERGRERIQDDAERLLGRSADTERGQRVQRREVANATLKPSRPLADVLGGGADIRQLMVRR